MHLGVVVHDAFLHGGHLMHVMRGEGPCQRLQSARMALPMPSMIGMHSMLTGDRITSRFLGLMRLNAQQPHRLML
jgi:hypothetical protein